jgi:hypothetical protein
MRIKTNVQHVQPDFTWIKIDNHLILHANVVQSVRTPLPKVSRLCLDATTAVQESSAQKTLL